MGKMILGMELMNRYHTTVTPDIEAIIKEEIEELRNLGMWHESFQQHDSWGDSFTIWNTPSGLMTSSSGQDGENIPSGSTQLIYISINAKPDDEYYEEENYYENGQPRRAPIYKWTIEIL